MSHDVFRSNSSGPLNCNDTGGGDGFPLYSLVDIMTLVMGFHTNSYVIWLIVTGTGNGIASEFFSLNLSICEMIICLNTLLCLTSESYNISFVSFIGQGLAMTGRPLFQSMICVERYLAVVHPVTFLKSKPLRYRLICCAFAWTAIFASCGTVTVLFSFNIFAFYFCFTLAQLVFFLFLQLFCCLAVLRVLKQSGPGDKVREKPEENHMKRRAFKIILIITVTMVIIYTPIIISSVLFLCSARDSDIVLTVAEYSYSFGGLVQPFLFLHRVGKLCFTKCR